MIRNVVVGRLRAAADEAQAASDADLLAEGLAAIAALRCEGCLGTWLGRDAGLRDGAWSFAITNDWIDAEAYRGYDADVEHNRIRAAHFAPVCSEIARVQFAVPD